MKLLPHHGYRSPYADLAFFAGWTPADLQRMERVVEVVDYEPGEFITVQGAPAVEFVVIVCGTAAVIADNEPVCTLTSGDTVGEVALLAGTTSPVAVVAQTYLKALLLGPRQFNGLLTAAPSMGRRLAALMADRLRDQPGRAAATHVPRWRRQQVTSDRPRVETLVSHP